LVEAARDLKRQIAEKGLPKGSDFLTASAGPTPPWPMEKCATPSPRIFVEVEVDTDLGHARVLKYLAVHDCGRIINPLTAEGRSRAAS